MSAAVTSLQQQMSEQLSATIDAAANLKGADNLDATTLADLIKQKAKTTIIVDAREEEDFKAGKTIATATNIPYSDFLTTAGTDKLKGLIDAAITASSAASADAITVVFVSQLSPDLDDAAAALWSEEVATDKQYSAVKTALLLGGLNNWSHTYGTDAALTTTSTA